MSGDVETRMKTAKLFWNGGAQAVRLPKEFRFQGEEVHVRRVGTAVILEPVSQDWSWLDAIQGTRRLPGRPPTTRPSGTRGTGLPV